MAYRSEKCAGKRIINDALAEAVRFELTDGFPSPVFKTGAIDHSATLPVAPILAGPQQAPSFNEFDHLG